MNVMHDFGGLSSPGLGGSPGPTSVGQYHDSELGSSAALTELEKGLRSPKFGEQCRAVVKFQGLIEKNPFPVIINSALLKLAEVFRQGPNFLKLCVLRVFEGSQRHLDKMTSVDELVRRIITVMNSNDPVARALTLRTFGSLASILCDKKQIHHKVRTGLDSNDTVELEAAIFSAERFAARSKTFSTDICSKLLEMIKGFATPLSIKLKMIGIFCHMHHDGVTASRATTNCLELLSSYPGQEFVITILQTLTSLSRHTLLHIPKQVTLLLKYLKSDPRRQVQDQVLNDLKILAQEETAHLWTKENIDNLVDYISTAITTDTSNNNNNINLSVAALNVLIAIVEAGAMYKLDLSPCSPIMNLLQTSSYSMELAVAASSTQLLTHLAVCCAKEGLDGGHYDILSEATQAIESLCLLVSGGQSHTAQEINCLKKAFKCVTLLCATKPDCTGQFVDILGGMLMSKHDDMTSLMVICETLAALADVNQGVLNLLLNDICGLISGIVSERELGSCSSTDSESNSVLVLLLTTLIQTMRGHSWSNQCKQTFRCGTEIVDAWSQYKLVRTAMRYGEHSVGVKLSRQIKDKVYTDRNHHWLSSLELFTTAEEILCSRDEGRKKEQDKMNAALNTFHRGLTTLRAASSPTTQLHFQIQFIRCRIWTVEALYQLVSAATSLQTSPPPAIAAALAQQSRDDLQRCGRVTSQLRNAVKELQKCARDWGSLAEASFDADLASLALIRILEKAISNLAIWIEIVCLKSNLQGSMYADTEIEFVPELLEGYSPSIQIQTLIKTFQNISSEFAALARRTDTRPISHHHTSAIFSAVRAVHASPLPYPRFFFQSLQETKLKLSVSPHNRMTGIEQQPVSVKTSELLAIKVEGVIERSGVERKLLREVNQVSIVLTTSQVNKKQDPNIRIQSKLATQAEIELEQSADVLNDFFSVQFLAPFPCPGLFNCTLEAFLIDKEANRWRPDVKHSISVKSFEDRNVASARSINRS